MKTVNIRLFDLLGKFAENKDVARDIRSGKIVPAIDMGQSVILDFKGVDATTQSFVHALISDLIRKYGPEVLDKKITFKDCNLTIQKIIEIVVDYMQQSD